MLNHAIYIKYHYIRKGVDICYLMLYKDRHPCSQVLLFHMVSFDSYMRTSRDKWFYIWSLSKTDSLRLEKCERVES